MSQQQHANGTIAQNMSNDGSVTVSDPHNRHQLYKRQNPYEFRYKMNDEIPANIRFADAKEK